MLDDLKLATGHCELRRNALTGAAVMAPKSINFASMDQTAFQRFVDRCCFVLAQAGIDTDRLMDESRRYTAARKGVCTMLLTEEQARSKWCPMVRYEGDDGGSWNRGSAKDDPTNTARSPEYYSCACVASSCMAWRILRADIPGGESRGYCGAFGRP
ncbi:MAG: hypothetical protein MZV49_12190 [Rhodopseudomonas palustris]|nr:hypothetical protein [Rhodopseudomonas palustris]